MGLDRIASGSESRQTADVPESRQPSPATAEPLNPYAAPTISLPKGGGAIRGMGEKFSANPVTGSLSVPIACSTGRGRCLLRDGPRLCRLLSTVRAASGRCLLLHPREVAHGCTKGPLGRRRSRYRSDLRSTRDAQRLLIGQEVSRASEARSVQGPRVGQDAGLPDQQHSAPGIDHLRAVQGPLAGRAVLQVDQAASAHQAFPGQQRERGEDAGLVRSRHLRAHRYRQEGASTRCLALYVSTDLVGLDLRENRDFMRLADRSVSSPPT